MTACARRIQALATFATLFLASCGGEESATSPDTAPEVVTPDATTPDAAPERAVGCCPQGICPTSEACYAGACLPVARGEDACYLAAECAPGQICAGAVTCACGETCEPTAGRCAWPEGCCNADTDCAAGQRCEGGRCLDAPRDGCWADGDCAAGRACEGAKVCGCGDSGCESTPGWCALPGVCCVLDAECGPDGQCLDGRCVAEPAGDSCWRDADCGGAETCRGASTCPCTPGAGDVANCALPSTPVRCEGPDNTCCSADADCGAGELCVEGRGCLPRPDVAANSCWVDGHCGAGRVCEGATLCDCNEADCAPRAGTCRTEVIACNPDSSQCPAGLKCVVPDRAFCPGEASPEEGVCVPLNDEGCWTSDDCNPNVRCGAEVVCLTEGGCEAPNRPGICDTKVRKWDCCNSHRECGPGLECRNQNSSQTCPPSGSAVCVPIPDAGRTCWNYDDCPDGLACQKVVICGCNGRCFFNRIGQCEAPTFCEADTDCGDFMACARDVECILSPCSSVTTCPFGGTCQERVEGRCWNHETCETGEYCAGLQICPPDTTCAYPDTPGLCAPRADLGECCSSYKGCKPGLRCVSGGLGSSCSLDTTSVCVPATAVGGLCYTDEDCDRSEFCEGEHVCPCGLEGCEGDPRPGRCAAR